MSFKDDVDQGANNERNNYAAGNRDPDYNPLLAQVGANHKFWLVVINLYIRNDNIARVSSVRRFYISVPLIYVSLHLVLVSPYIIARSFAVHLLKLGRAQPAEESKSLELLVRECATMNTDTIATKTCIIVGPAWIMRVGTWTARLCIVVEALGV